MALPGASGRKHQGILEAKQPQFPQPLLIRLVLQTLHQLHSPSLDSLQHLNVSLVVRGPKLNTVFKFKHCTDFILSYSNFSSVKPRQREPQLLPSQLVPVSSCTWPGHPARKQDPKEMFLTLKESEEMTLDSVSSQRKAKVKLCCIQSHMSGSSKGRLLGKESGAGSQESQQGRQGKALSDKGTVPRHLNRKAEQVHDSNQANRVHEGLISTTPVIIEALPPSLMGSALASGLRARVGESKSGTWAMESTSEDAQFRVPPDLTIYGQRSHRVDLRKGLATA
ncbi:hypothetical protein QYF61_021982 [Mycteria americana]|uniref:Uncharacterized protein n=1 Tax=Mycteria americana TaxID=33587 RepID=A0AAN7P9M9_MYCAM|nr:hypothetical protein QYF61_021982 [Mycteria americana]